MSNDDPRKPRVEHPRVPPEIIPPRGRQQQRGFDSLFIRVEEGDDGIRRVYLKKPGPFTVVLILLAAGAVAALFFLLLAGLCCCGSRSSSRESCSPSFRSPRATCGAACRAGSEDVGRISEA